MNFNQIIKTTLLPVISSYGFAVSDEGKGYSKFRKDEFEIAVSYDYYLSKDINLIICYQADSKSSYCIRDYEIESIFNYKAQYEKLPEDEQVYKFARYYGEIFKTQGAILFNRRGFFKVWEKTSERIVL